MRFNTPLPLTLLLCSSLVACAAGTDDADIDNNPPLSSIDDLFEGTPKNDDVARELGKFDDLVPQKHTALVAMQSSVKSQGSRGVCSIFSTAGYMEHMYKIEGSIPNLDVSEQYLQWSAKFEVGSFQQTSGSNASVNLQAISRFGVPAEGAWPFESSQWGSLDDEACTGEDDQPTRCYTNGHPSDQTKAAEKFFLPTGRFFNNRDIAAQIATNETAVIVGFDFFYQAWNHRSSDLPTSSTNWDLGIVTYPNDEDKRLSSAKRAGHSILLVGYDMDKEVTRLDENGEPLLDSNGNPVVEKGFYLLKNSWGTSGFGKDNEHGAGYGWISMRYISEFGRARIAGLPDVQVPAETCDDGFDNDGDNAADCDDSDCALDAACSTETTEVSFSADGSDIPDNDETGMTSDIRVVGDDETGLAGTVVALSVAVNITHTFRGDLLVSLHRGDETVVLHNKKGGSEDDLNEVYALEDFNGADLAGDWTLAVKDLAGQDLGRLDNWTLTATITNE